MSLLQRLSERQQQAMHGDLADRGTRMSLYRRGLCEEPTESGFAPVRLTAYGRWLMLEHAQRDNTVAMFKPGDRVVHMQFAFYGGERTPYLTRFAGTVVSVDPEANEIEVDRGVFHGKANVSPDKLAHRADVDAAGLLDLVYS